MRLALALLLLPTLALPTLAAAQDPDEDREPGGIQRSGELTKAQERAKFHADRPLATSAEARAKSYAQRLKMEADSAFGSLIWRNIGPEVQGGRALTIASPRDLPGTVYVAYATGGLFRTTDDGATWTSLWDAMPSFGIGDIALSPDGKTIVVGTGEPNSQRTSYAGTGVYRSDDAGKTWRSIGLPESHHIGKVILDPKNTNVIWVASLGHLYSPNAERGVYKTLDGGKSWTQSLKVDEWTGAVSLVLDPRNSNIATASMWTRDRRAWNFLESGKGSGVYRTEDGGKSWRPVSGLPAGDALGRTGLATCPADPKVVYAYIDNQGANADWLAEDDRRPSGVLTPRRFARLDEKVFLALPRPPLEAFWKEYAPDDAKLDDALADVKAGKATMAEIRERIEKKSPELFDGGLTLDELYRSEDGGRSFHRVSRLGPHGGYYWGKVYVSPTDVNDVWLGGVEMLRSRDGGKTWAVTASEAHSDHHAVFFDPSRAGKIWIGNDGGIDLSLNDGVSFRAVNNLSVGQATTLALDQKSDIVYTGLQDNGTMKGSRRYVPGRSPLENWKAIAGGDGSHVALDPRPELDLVYTASQFGAHSALVQSTNARYRAAATRVKGLEPLRYNWISTLIVSNFVPDVVYLGSQYVHRSFDRGKTWTAISPDLTRNRPNGDVPFSTIKDISESPLRFGLIYVGADDGRLSMTPDGGFQWIDIPTPTPTKWIPRIVASQHDVATVYCAQNGYREDDFAAYLWRSKDFGKTWVSIVGDLPAESINVVREDPKEPGTLYVGTDMGAWVTRDSGTHWEPLGVGLGHIPVHDLAIHAKDDEIVVATHARGLFTMALKPLRMVDAKVRAETLTVLDAPDATVPITLAFGARNVWDGSFRADPQARISLWTRTAGPATLELIDAGGKVLTSAKVDVHRGYNDVLLPLTIKPGVTMPLGQIPPTPKTADEALQDPYAQYRPVFTGPGTYTLRVTVAGEKTETKLKIVN